ncbi:hypothetical protein [Faecalibacter macacae]|uniref:Sugar-binding protein n=1 Tax=Faecalibacter macacae TaxID=1859289 RepID=A0A3L9M0J8_9FLAO|nr:hypothetical protein [Faecalibacter macacae]RLZ06495.1 hypothetical protein EAH69_13240 [Faecalibacter macacae]
MIKKYSSILILVGGILFAQTTDLEKEKINNSPKSVEESFTKAIIRANIIEDYIQEFHTKTSYNTKGNINQKEHYSDTGDLLYTENYTYNDEGKLVKIEMTTEDQSFTKIHDFEYTTDGYKEIKSENETVIAETLYKIVDNKIVYQKDTSLLENGIFTERTNEYKGEQLLKTDVKYGKDGYVVNYKYNQNLLPIEEVVYDLKGKLVSKKRRKFDEKGNIIEENLYDSTGRLKTNNRIKYEYDTNGNWTVRTQFANNLEQPVSNSKRTIRY